MPELQADLVLEGGGVKGIGLVGAYSVLAERGYEVRRVAGTSAGAIVGALVAAGVPTGELVELMREVDYRSFQDEGLLDRVGALGKGLSLLFEKGIYEGDHLRSWLDGLLGQAGTRTWGDLRVDDPGSSLPDDKAYRLVVMVSDVTRGRLVTLPWDYPSYGVDPDEQPVADAVRASMSIPFFYEPARLGSSYLVDGGILSNFPIGVFDRTDGRRPRWPTLGIKLSGRPGPVHRPRFPVEGTLDFARALVGTMITFYDQMHIDDECTQKRTMFVDTTGVRAVDFDLSPAERDRLFGNGRAAAKK
ncbi:MAG: patatin-like phospholipase family protein, partial [Actinomycetota bacterium]